jgi:hypothetical protein
MRPIDLKRRAPVMIVTAFALTVTTYAPTGALQQGTGDIRKIKKIVDPQTEDDSVAKVTDAVRIIRQLDLLDSLRAREKMELLSRDVLLLQSMWRTHLRLTLDDEGTRGRLTLLPELLTRDGLETVLGPRAGPEGGLYSILRGEGGRTEVQVHRGALIIKDWEANKNETICVRAAGACASNTGTTYAIRQDTTTGVASIFVESGQVEITQDGAAPFTAVESTAYRWSDSTEIVPIPLGLEAIARLQDAIQYNGDDLWDDFREETLLVIPVTAVIICLLTDIWFCGGGDATGTVTVSP